VTPGRQLIFAAFRLDITDQRLWRGAETIPLAPKVFAVLHYLVRHAGRLVTKDELLKAVWPDVHVSDAVLKVCIRAIRQALGDQARVPQFVETCHRRGYRFLGAVTEAAGPPSARSEEAASSRRDTGGEDPGLLTGARAPVRLVGRGDALGRLEAWWDEACRGRRRIVFITGEAGIGKTALVEAFVRRLASDGPRPWVAHGQCVEQYGSGEAYLPVLEALGRLCRGSSGQTWVGGLRRYAPLWLAQLPGLLEPAEGERLRRELAGTTGERMLREMAEALEALTAERRLVLVFEDLHWSDHATLDLIVRLARRPESAGLLVVATYRPVEVIVGEHPLRRVKAELAIRGQCEELSLEPLSEDAVAEYLEARFPASNFPRGLATVLQERTDGNPLFMVTVVEDWIGRGFLQERDGHWALSVGLEQIGVAVPEGIRRLLDEQIARLEAAEQRALEAAAVAGMRFSAAVVAAALDEGLVPVEVRCDDLARRQAFLRRRGAVEWPDGTMAAAYEFRHWLYQRAWYQRVGPARRVELHRRIGERIEAAYGDRATEAAAELAMHFDRGRDIGKAVRYLTEAARTARRRHGAQEIARQVRHALALLEMLPGSDERARQEADLWTMLGATLLMTRGYGSPEVEQAYARAHALCERVGDSSQLFFVLAGLRVNHLFQEGLQSSRELAEKLLGLAARSGDAGQLALAHLALGTTLYWLGELGAARANIERAVALSDAARPDIDEVGHRYHQEPGVVGLCHLAWMLWILGYPDRALQHGHDAIARADRLAHPPSRLYALFAVAMLHRLRRDARACQEGAEALIAFSKAQGFAPWLAWGTIVRGWALAEQGQEAEGIVQLGEGLAALRATGAERVRPSALALFAEVQARAGQLDDARSSIEAALAAGARTGERAFEPERHRLRGELVLGHAERATRTEQERAGAEAESCFRQAIDAAQRLGARSWELRAATSLARLWSGQGRGSEAARLLGDCRRWFTEGLDTADVQSADRLLDELGDVPRETGRRRAPGGRGQPRRAGRPPRARAGGDDRVEPPRAGRPSAPDGTGANPVAHSERRSDEPRE
jgi:DNA-binding winged helix-turn-helix (wHTH) protein/predicted ATPase